MTTEHRAEIRFYTLKTALKKFHVNRNSEKGRYHYTGKIKEKPATCTIYKGGYVYKYGRGSRTTMGVSCTKAQALQIQIEYDFYRDLWKEEVDFFMDAFIQKHRIFAEPTEGGGTDESKMSKEDLFRMMAMMGVMQDKSVKPLLESK